jgi:hypothetical protein
MAAKTFSRTGGFLKFIEVGVVLKYYNLNELQIEVSGDFVDFPDGNSYAYNDPELTNVFASAEAFADQVGTWKREAQGSGGGAVTELNDLTDVQTALPTTPTEADNGRILFYDFDLNKFSTEDSINYGTVVINGKKASAGTIAKGKPVYLVGFDNDLHTVEEANASSASTMPVIGFAAEQLDATNSKNITTFGKVTGVDTSIYSVGDILYMDVTTGLLTTTRPTGGSSLIQRIAKVLKVDATGGQIFVFNTARTAGLPNIDNDNLWLGNASGQPVSTKRKAVNNSIDNSITTTSALTPNVDEYDQETITALNSALTINAPTGTASNGMKLLIRINDNGTNRALTFNAIYQAIGVTLPTTTTANKTLYIGCIYNSNAVKWDVIAVKEQA